MIKHLKGLHNRLPNGEIKNMGVERGKNLNYLGMNFDLSTQGQLAITMPYHISNVIQEFRGKLKNLTISSPKTVLNCLS